jgi:hypothetical protein
MRELIESRDAYERALQAVQLAMHAESNEVAKKELMISWNRIASRLEEIQNRINRARR